MKRLVGFGDADSFYSSAEVIRRPWLHGLPVGVLGNQGACVIARNYPMKKYGVKVGEPIWEAKAKCPDGVYVKRDFRWYEAVSRRMLAEVGRFSPTVEYYSIDEFFWKGEATCSPSAAAIVRDHIKKSIGMPMTVAFARTRTLAKLFADTAKPFGAVVVTNREQERELLAKLPVTEIAGIAKRRALRLEPHGIRTCLELADANGLLIRQLLTAAGHDLWLELNGVQATPIRPTRSPHKMLARGGSLAGRVRDPRAVYGWLVRNVERLIEELHYHELRAKAISFYIAYLDEGGAGSTRHLNVPSDRFDEILAAAKAGLRRVWRTGQTATHMHVVATGLTRRGGWQQTLFESLDGQRAEAIAAVKREINERYGRWKLRSGATLFANEWYEDPANEHEVCDIRGKFCF